MKPIIAVPARDESERLPRLFRALSEQTWCQVTGHRLPVIVVLNNCTDVSAYTVRAMSVRYPCLDIRMREVWLDAHEAHVGTARRIALDTASAAIADEEDAVLLTTDADAQPDRTWVSENLKAVWQGADLVGGHIIGDPREEALFGPRFVRRSRLHARYNAVAQHLASLIDPIPWDPWPRHGDHTGGSLAIRAGVYRAVGGLPDLPVREDLALVRRVVAAGYRLRHPQQVRVTVSARARGRAEGGMADCIRRWLEEEERGQPLMVEDPLSIAVRARKRQMLRQLDRDGALGVHDTARELGLDVSLFLQDGQLLPAATLIDRLAPDDPDPHDTVPVHVAIGQLEAMIGDAEAGEYAA